jgi:PAS domain S-box-containing protein
VIDARPFDDSQPGCPSLGLGRDELVAAVEQAAEAIVVTDTAGTIRYVNPAFSTLTGYSPVEAVGQNPRILRSGRQAPEYYAALWQTIGRGQVWSGVLVNRRKDGSEYPEEMTITPVRDAGGVVTSFIAIKQDVTDRNRAEASLREREAEYRLLLDSSQEAICGSDLDGRCTFANPAAARLLGLPVERIVGADLHALWHHSRPDGSGYPVDECRIRRAVVRGETLCADDELFWRADGTPFPVACRSHPVERDGRLVGAVVTFADVSERRRAEDHRRRSEEWFRAAFQDAPFPMTITTPDGEFVQVNAAFRDLVGYSETELLAMGWQGLTHPDDLDACRRGAARLASGQCGWAEIAKRYLHKDGRTIWAQVKVSVVREAATGSLRFITHIQDVSAHRAAECERQQAESALRDSEERVRQITDNIREAFWLMDAETGRMEYISAAYEAIWGRTRESLYDGTEPWPDTLHPADLPRMREARIAPALADAMEEEYRIVRPDGSVRWIRDRASPVRDASGRVVRIAGAAEDITERRQLEAQLRQSQKMESIGQLAGGIAHDFNNILGAISGHTELALMDVEARADVVTNLEAVRGAMHRAADLVRQILAFSRQQSPERHIVSVGSAVQDAIRLLRASIPSSVRITTTIDPATPAICADATEIHQVVMNLVTNAWQAMDAREGLIEIAVGPYDGDGGTAPQHIGIREGPYAMLTVRDTGPGMDAQTLERIFDPFFTTKAPGRGTGLGLSTVHGIIKSLAGTVLVDSVPGAGSTFRVLLPAAESAGATDLAVAPGVPAGQGERVLFVDDEEALTRLGASMLTRLGYTVEACADPLRAFDKIANASERFDLVITDLTMPGANGLKVAGFAHDLCPHLPIILTTGNPTSLTAEDIGRCGIIEVLAKPVSMRLLGEAVHRALSRRGARCHGTCAGS